MTNKTARRTTIREVASHAGVSYQTVSRVINNHPEVSVETRAQVLRAITELDYHPNAQAVSLSRNRSDIIGVVVSHIIGSFFAEITEGIARSLERHQRFMLMSCASEPEQEEFILSLQRSRRIDGLIVVLPVGASLERVRHLAASRMPIVLIDVQYAVDVTGIMVDNTQGAEQAVEYLIGLGHHRIGIINGRNDIPVGQMRMDGYRMALARHGICADPALMVPGRFDFESGVAGTEQLLSLAYPPSAIFATNDIMALGVVQAATRRGLRVPDDLSVIGFDDTVEARYSLPPLTTMRQPLREMGEIAVQLLLQRLDEPGMPPERVVVPTELVLRSSCAPLRQHMD